MNSNEPIFKRDLASLNYSKPMAFIQDKRPRGLNADAFLSLQPSSLGAKSDAR